MSDHRPDEADSPATPSPDDAWRPTPEGDGDGTADTPGAERPAAVWPDEGTPSPAAEGDTPTEQFPASSAGRDATAPTEQVPTAAPTGHLPAPTPTQQYPTTPATQQFPSSGTTGAPSSASGTGGTGTGSGAGTGGAPTGQPSSPWVNPGTAQTPPGSGDPTATGTGGGTDGTHLGALPPYTAPGGQQTDTGTAAGPDVGGTAGSGASPTRGYSPWSSTATGPAAGPSAGPTAGGTSPSDVPGAGAGTYGAPAYGAPPTGDAGAYTQYTQSAAAPSSTRTRQRSGRGPGWLALLVAMVVTAMIAVGSTLALGGGTQTAEPAATTTTQSTSQTVSPVQSSGDAPDWEAVAAAVSPATVTITVESQSSSDIGSGVIYDASGHIVTNYHVISAAVSSSSTTSNTSSSTSGTITVTLSDGRVYEATVVGSDQTTDLAVIQLTNPPSDLTVATFGSSADLVVGQSVMAIGSPLGLSDTVTTGVVSALNRPVEVSTSETQETDPDDPFGQLPQQNQQQSSTDSVITNAIQVDASINPGNSGGPLFDATGAVVGINSSIASLSSSSDSSGSIGLGFAIPSDLVKSVADQLISTGTVDHAVLGVTIQSGTATVDGTTRIGAEVASMTSGGAAAEAGIKEGDVILSVDGNQVSSAKSLSGYVRRYKSGDSVTLEVARDGAIQKIQVTLGSKG